MKPFFSFVGLCSALLLSQPSTLTANTNSLVATWETQLIGPGRDRTTCYLTFSNDLTWAGYGIALKSLGPVTITGTWDVDAHGLIIGSFTEHRNAGAIAGTLTRLVASRTRIRGGAIATQGRINLKGIALGTPPDLSGDWTGEVMTGGNTSFQSYTFSISTNGPGWFDITGTGVGEGGMYTITGAVVVASDRSANGYLVSDFGTGNTTSTWSFAGKFLPSLERATFRGHADTGNDVLIHATKQ